MYFHVSMACVNIITCIPHIRWQTIHIRGSTVRGVWPESALGVFEIWGARGQVDRELLHIHSQNTSMYGHPNLRTVHMYNVHAHVKLGQGKAKGIHVGTCTYVYRYRYMYMRASSQGLFSKEELNGMWTCGLQLLYMQCSWSLNVIACLHKLIYVHVIHRLWLNLLDQTNSYPLRVLSHMHSLLRCVDLTVTEVLCVDESRETVLKTSSHSNTLTWTTPVIKMLPYLTDRHIQYQVTTTAYSLALSTQSVTCAMYIVHTPRAVSEKASLGRNQPNY